jgi:hypothetical protein
LRFRWRCASVQTGAHNQHIFAASAQLLVISPGATLIAHGRLSRMWGALWEGSADLHDRLDPKGR